MEGRFRQLEHLLENADHRRLDSRTPAATKVDDEDDAKRDLLGNMEEQIDVPTWSARLSPLVRLNGAEGGDDHHETVDQRWRSR